MIKLEELKHINNAYKKGYKVVAGISLKKIIKEMEEDFEEVVSLINDGSICYGNEDEYKTDSRRCAFRYDGR